MKFAHKSYLKPLLHAAKHPTTAVNGVFLADKSTGHVVDAVPLFHFWNTLTPMLEVAMSQVLDKPNGILTRTTITASGQKFMDTRIAVGTVARNSPEQRS
jgi:hypothetical protein